MIPLQLVILLFVAIMGVAVVVSRDPLKQIIVIGFYGLLLAVLFLVFQAPDVALSMLVVQTVAYPLVVLVAISRVRDRPHDPEEERDL